MLSTAGIIFYGNLIFLSPVNKPKMMVKNYLKLAWRNINRQKIFALVNILGLATGLCACIIIYLIVSYEFSFDRFHPDNKKIYRVMGDITESTGDQLHFARVPAALSQIGRESLSGLDKITSVIPYNVNISIPGNDKSATQFDSKVSGSQFVSTVIAEKQYFEIFKYDWLAGDSKSAFDGPYSVVLTESRARTYFGTGSLQEMIGRRVSYQDSLMLTVSGIVKDWKENSDLLFTDFISSGALQSGFLKKSFSSDSWGQGSMAAWVFVKIGKENTPENINNQLVTLVQTHAPAQTKLVLWLEPLTNMHFNADVIENSIRTAHRPTLSGLVAIAFFILILAIINFINLSTAQSIQRTKEVSIRKVLGSSPASLVFQFLTETILLTSIAILIAVLLVKPMLAAFREFIPGGVQFHLFKPSVIFFLLIVTLITSLFSGLYPAKLFSTLVTGKRLNTKVIQLSREKWLLRKGLIVFQFSVSLLFIIGSVVITRQLNYTREKDLGFSSDAILTIDTPRGDSLSKIAVLNQKIKEIPGVQKVALQWLSPMTDNPRGMKLKFKSTDAKDFWVTQVAGNEEFIPVYSLKLMAGRNLVKSDSVTEFVINENLAQLMGHYEPSKAIGQTLYWNDKPYPVVGVVADFHTSSLHNPITPLCIINRPDREGSLAIKLNTGTNQSGTIKNSIAQLEQVWKQIYPSHSFKYRFYDEALGLLYEKDKQTSILMNVAMAIAIFISCIGLFGLSLFSAKKRAKEISIRKIVGASAINITMLLGKDVVVLVLISLLITSPVGWYFMNQWLSGFAYRMPIDGWVFIIAGIIALLIALLTISFQAIKAAIANPIKNLRTE